MARAAKKIKPSVNIVPVLPKDVERFWPLAEFMIKEALIYSEDMQNLLTYIVYY